MLAAEDSAVVAKKDHHCGTLSPQRAKPNLPAITIGQGEGREPAAVGLVHGKSFSGRVVQLSRFAAQQSRNQKKNQFLTADLRGFTLINQNLLKHGGSGGNRGGRESTASRQSLQFLGWSSKNSLTSCLLFCYTLGQQVM
jgi:hypothetical protein